MPEMYFKIQWPDGSTESCYSPSLIIKDYFAAGNSYPIAEFLKRSQTALQEASDRVEKKYGVQCSRALGQRHRIETNAKRWQTSPISEVKILSFEE